MDFFCWVEFNIISLSIYIFPFLSGDVVKTANSNALRTVLKSPFEISAKKLITLFSIDKLYAPNPLSLLDMQKLSAFAISFFCNSLNLKTVDLEIRALLTSKYGFSVVAPINISLPFST
ncbi:hypothetical protein D3C76_819460 [compost metagenome]